MSSSNDKVARSWFCVFNNPSEHGYAGRSPKEVIECLRDVFGKSHFSEVAA